MKPALILLATAALLVGGCGSDEERPAPKSGQPVDTRPADQTPEIEAPGPTETMTVPEADAGKAKGSELQIGPRDFPNGDWPLKVKAAILTCDRDGRVTVSAAGKRYLVYNPVRVPQADLPPVADIAKRDPRDPAATMNLAALTNLGTPLCN